MRISGRFGLNYECYYQKTMKRASKMQTNYRKSDFLFDSIIRPYIPNLYSSIDKALPYHPSCSSGYYQTLSLRADS